MLRVRRSGERGHLDHGWLDTYHTFSFGSYVDPEQMGFRALRVMNEDVIQGGTGFGMHPHRDMEIVTYVLAGGLRHADSMGNAGVIGAGELQRMSAGTGIWHSEANASETEPVHLYQIWLFPNRKGLEPSYEQTALDVDGRRGDWVVVASPEGQDGALRVHQDATLSIAALGAGQEIQRTIAPGRHAWLQVLRGVIGIGGLSLSAGDGVAISAEPLAALRSETASEVLLFDLA